LIPLTVESSTRATTPNPIAAKLVTSPGSMVISPAIVFKPGMCPPPLPKPLSFPHLFAYTDTISYLKLYLSSTPSFPYYFGDKSIVVHARNATSLTCTNFTMVNSNSSSSGSPSSTSAPVGGVAGRNPPSATSSSASVGSAGRFDTTGTNTSSPAQANSGSGHVASATRLMGAMVVVAVFLL